MRPLREEGEVQEPSKEAKQLAKALMRAEGWKIDSHLFVNGAYPKGAWATAARLGHEFGVLAGEDDEVLGFIPEDRLDVVLGWSRLSGDPADQNVSIPIVEDAVKRIPQLKEDLRNSRPRKGCLEFSRFMSIARAN
jgi:hypothetical protein